MKFYGFSNMDIDVNTSIRDRKLKIYGVFEISSIFATDMFCICKDSRDGEVMLFVELTKDEVHVSVDDDGKIITLCSIKSLHVPKAIIVLSTFLPKSGDIYYVISDEEYADLIGWSIDFPTEPDKPSLADFTQEIADAFGVESSQVSISISNLNSKD